MTPKFLTEEAMGILQSPTVTDETEKLLRFNLEPNMMNSVFETVFNLIESIPVYCFAGARSSPDEETQ